MIDSNYTEGAPGPSQLGTGAGKHIEARRAWGGATESFCYNYDAFGNRAANVNVQGSSCPGALQPTASYNANNQVTWVQNVAPAGFEYDPAGNAINDGTNMYAYDGDGRICAVATAQLSGGSVYMQYIYDAEGNRVAKGAIHLVNGALSCDTTVNGFTPTAAYVIGPGGEQLTETDGQGNWQHTNVYAAGVLLATYDQRGLHFQLSDWLSTRRVQTDALGNTEESCTSNPFGDGLACINPPNPPATADDATGLHFTGKERDAESGNDYFGARYYASSMGRFLSPDPAGMFVADLTNPQSWNFYTYALNNPLINTDPTGFECVWDNGSYDSNDDPQTGEDAGTNGDHSGCTGQGGTWMELGQGGNWSNTGNQALANLTQIPGISGADLDSSGNVTMYSVGTQSFNGDGTPFQNGPIPGSPDLSINVYGSSSSFPNLDVGTQLVNSLQIPFDPNQAIVRAAPPPRKPVQYTPGWYECLTVPGEANAAYRESHGQASSPSDSNATANGVGAESVRLNLTGQGYEDQGNYNAAVKFNGAAAVLDYGVNAAACGAVAR